MDNGSLSFNPLFSQKNTIVGKSIIINNFSIKRGVRFCKFT